MAEGRRGLRLGVDRQGRRVIFCRCSKFCYCCVKRRWGKTFGSLVWSFGNFWEYCVFLQLFFKMLLASLARIAILFNLAVNSVYGCGYPGAPAHSLVSFSDDVIGPGTVATYDCESGFELLGPVRRVCDRNATWVPPGVPFCVLNVAAGKAAVQSSRTQESHKTVDGSTSAFFTPSTCAVTDAEPAPWWYVNLLEPFVVKLVRVDFGAACCDEGQAATIVVRVGNNRPDLAANPICGKYVGMLEEGTPLFVPCSPAMPGAFVSIHLEGPPPSRLSICEAFVYTDQALPIESCPSFRDQPLGGTSSYNGKCYIFYDQQPLDFAGARRVCASRGGSLVDETSPALQGFLSWELWRRHRADPQGQYWLGAIRNPQDPNNWKWINGRDVTVSFWNLPGGNNNCSRFDGTKGWLWSDTDCHANLHFICQHRPVRCGIPERPPNSTILTTSDFTEGTMVEYRCGAGHILVGSSSRVCLPNGFYTETTPFCRYLECGLPAGVDNGEVMLLNGTMYLRSVARYTCQEGFELEGRAELSCDVDERWDGPPPRCRPTWCQPPPQIANGVFRASGNSSRLTVGTVLEYACRKSGFRLVGPKKLTCRSDGRWDNRPPNCTEIPGGFSPPKPETTTLPMATPVPAKTTTTTATATTTTFSTPTTSTAVVPDLEPSVAGSVTTAHYVRPYFPEAPPTTEKTERYEPPPAPAEVLPQDPVGSSSSESDGGDMWLAVPSPSPPALPPRNDAIPSSVPIPDPKKPDLRMEPSEVDAKVKEEMTTRAPIEPDWSGNEPGGSLQESESDNEIGFGVEVAGEGRSNTRLNLGGIIALSVFGALVLVAAILTMTVVMCRRSRRLRASADNTTVSTDDSLSSEGRGLNKYYKRAWENLRGSSDAVKSGHRLGDATDKGIGHTHRSHAQQLSRQETLDAPNYRTTTSNPGTIEGLRDTNEMTVSDATAWNTRKDRKRHHHHHHHRHNHRHRHSSPDSLNGRDSNWHDRS